MFLQENTLKQNIFKEIIFQEMINTIKLIGQHKFKSR